MVFFFCEDGCFQIFKTILLRFTFMYRICLKIYVSKIIVGVGNEHFLTEHCRLLKIIPLTNFNVEKINEENNAVKN